MMLASYVGTARHLASVRRGSKDAYGFNGEEGLARHILGASGELAVAKALDVYYDPTIDAFHEPDVRGFHVRTRSRPDYDLIIRPDDPPGRYVLVIGNPPAMDVVGALEREQVREEWLRDYGSRPPAYFVPRAALEVFWP